MREIGMQYLRKRHLRELESRGFVTFDLRDSSDLLKKTLDVCSEFAAFHEISMNFDALVSKDAGIDLPKHTECVYYPNIVRYFALVTQKQAEEGGELVLYDGIKTAEHLTQLFPSVLSAEIQFVRKRQPSFQTTQKVISFLSGYNTIVFRDTPEHDILSDGAGYEKEDLYDIINSSLEKNIVFEKSLKEGELIFVDNHKLLHSRKAYRGERSIIRIRFDDPLGLRI